MKKTFVTLVVLCFLVCQNSLAQVDNQPKALQKIATQLQRVYQQRQQKLTRIAKMKHWSMVEVDSFGNQTILFGIDQKGYPHYKSVYNNSTSAITTNTQMVWPMGSGGYGLSGSSSVLANKLGIWDGGAILSTHQELIGRIAQKDAATTISNHATHVAGTMIASGINSNAKGMSYGAPNLKAWDFNNDISEIAAEAANLLVSNHSYGILSGWTTYTDPATNKSSWLFRGEADATEDFKFGYYSDDAQALDAIAYNAPYYLHVKAAGNNRNQNGPAVGQPYFRYDANGKIVNAGNRPSGIYSNNSYDIIPWDGNAKNILTVGAINALPNGYTKSSDVRISNFSSYGPTDDGRIKPDLVGAGVSVSSSGSASNNTYTTLSGTSMASPNVSGSLLLLQELHYKINGRFMRAATLKGLAIHTTDEAGATAGPDYIFGWGVLNTGKAAAVIASKNVGKHLIQENTLQNGQSYSLSVVATNTGKLTATISWTDVEGSVNTTNYLNNRTPKLVNDLDMRIEKNGVVFLPWVLSPLTPSAAAQKGDNILDNVERIEIDSVNAGDVFTITITHKKTLTKGSQAYSLIVSGVGGATYCSSAATNNAGTRIDSVSFAGMVNKSSAGCSTYKNYTALAAQLAPGQSYPLAVFLNSCDATSANRVVKCYIDYNKNGQYESGEQVAASGILGGLSSTYNTTVTVPSTVMVGTITQMRIVVQETSFPANVTACGTYTKGETQDYTIEIVHPSIDVAAKAITWPVSGNCANTKEKIVVQVENKGSLPVTNIALRATVKIAGNNTSIASFIDTINATLAAGSVYQHTLNNYFTTQYGQKYQIQVTALSDKIAYNDTVTTIISTANSPSLPQAVGNICDSNTLLKIIQPNSNTDYYWYTPKSLFAPFATGNSITIDKPSSDNKFYTTTGVRGEVGLAAKNAYPNLGSYVSANANLSYINYESQAPMILESARLYTRNAGNIHISVVDVNNNTVNYLSSTTLSVPSSSNAAAAGNQPDDLTDTGRTYFLNLYLPAGKHQILVSPDASASIYRHDSIPGTDSIYPMLFGKVFSITGNNQSAQNNYYFYLYNIQLRTATCISDTVSVVTTKPAPPIITATNNILNSNATIGNQWYRVINGVPTPIAGANNSTYQPDSTGVYRVVVTDANGCSRSSANYVYESLPLQLLSFEAFMQTANAVTIQWQTQSEINVAHFELAFSTDGQHFSTIATQIANNQTALNTYLYKHQLTNLSNTYFYRLKMVDKDGKSTLSSIIKINNNNTNQFTIRVLNNPVTNSLLPIRITGVPKNELLQAHLIDFAGKQLSLGTVQGQATQIQLPANLSKGIYLLLLQNENRNSKATLLVE